MAGRLPQLPGERPTVSDWSDHLTTLFPEVRLKRFVEMRGADAGPWSRLCALPALWTGLLYDQTSLDAAWDLVKDWTEAERESLRASVPRLALKAPFRGGTLRPIAHEMVRIARQGLVARANPSLDHPDESSFLDTIEAIAESGLTPAEILLRKYEREWHGNIDRIFEEEAY
jgi:glutamate--cysteine ligase